MCVLLLSINAHSVHNAMQTIQFSTKVSCNDEIEWSFLSCCYSSLRIQLKTSSKSNTNVQITRQSVKCCHFGWKISKFNWVECLFCKSFGNVELLKIAFSTVFFWTNPKRISSTFENNDWNLSFNEKLFLNIFAWKCVACSMWLNVGRYKHRKKWKINMNKWSGEKIRKCSELRN